MNDDPSLRLFTALELPEEWREVLARHRADLERVASGQWKWVRPELMHLTLVFLGQQSPDSLPTIEAALGTARSEVPPFRLSLGQPGSFGQLHSLQVIWVGLADVPTELRGLHQAITTHLSAAGMTFDQKPLVPHITIARARRPIDRAASLRAHAALQGLRTPTGLRMAVGEFVLMRSQLSRLGPDYQVVARFPLGDTNG